MKTILTVAALMGVMSMEPVWAGEGQGEPFAFSAGPINTTMAQKLGGDDEYFKWTALPSQSRYSQKLGGDDEYFKWSASPVPPAAAQATRPMTGNGSHG